MARVIGDERIDFMESPCPNRCGAIVRGRTGHYRLCDECRVIARRATMKRYRERQKLKPDFERPFLREQHSMTEADYEQMLGEQDYQCAGCKRVAPVAGKDLHIDHDHSTCHPEGGRSCVDCRRGLLCAECNMALGLLADSPERLEALAAYLRKWKGGVKSGTSQ